MTARSGRRNDQSRRCAPCDASQMDECETTVRPSADSRIARIAELVGRGVLTPDTERTAARHGRRTLGLSDLRDRSDSTASGGWNRRFSASAPAESGSESRTEPYACSSSRGVARPSPPIGRCAARSATACAAAMACLGIGDREQAQGVFSPGSTDGTGVRPRLEVGHVRFTERAGVAEGRSECRPVRAARRCPGW